MAPTALIEICAVASTAMVTASAAFTRRFRTRALRRRLGPEYDRLLAELGSRKAADAEARRRIRAWNALRIAPLTAPDLEYYLQSWDQVQGEYVDDPATALAAADRLVVSLIHERGYPSAPTDQLEVLSAGHGPALSAYRDAREVLARARQRHFVGSQELLKAMDSCGRLFDELLMDADVPTPRARKIRVS